MSHGRNHLGQQMISGVDLAIDFATLGEYGLEPRLSRQARAGARTGHVVSGPAGGPDQTAGPDGRRSRRPAAAPVRHRAGARRRSSGAFPAATLRRADFRSAIERYAA